MDFAAEAQGRPISSSHASRGGSPRESGYIPALDGWRAVSIALVMASHTPEWIRLRYPSWTAFGGLGVSVFFGISGFLICSKLLDEYRRDGRVSLRAFYWRRAFRILPAAWGYLGLISLLAVCGVIRLSWDGVLGCLLFVRNYWWPKVTEATWYTGHFWSLSVEEHFYLVFPAALALARPRRLVWVTPLWIGAVVVWRFVATRAGWTALYSATPFPALLSDIRFDSLLWGCWAAILFHFIRWRPIGRWWGWAAWLPAAALFAVMPRLTDSPNVYYTVMPVLIAAALVLTAFNPRSLLGRALELAPVRWVGRLSYSLYLYQQLFFQEWFLPEPTWIGTFQEWPYCLAATVGCACASYYLVERPLIAVGRAFGKRLFRKPPPGESGNQTVAVTAVSCRSAGRESCHLPSRTDTSPRL